MPLKSCRIKYISIGCFILMSVFMYSSAAISDNKVVVIPLSGSRQAISNSYFELNRTIENLEDWNTSYGGSDATYTQTGTTSTVSLSGNDTETDVINFEKDFPDANGLIGTMNLESINEAAAGFGMYIGKLGVNHIHTNINFNKWNGEIVLRYKLRLRDSDNNDVETLAWGFVPANDLLGQDVKIGFVKIENAVHFYINGELLFKWQPTETIAPRERTFIWYWEWVAQNTAASVVATFKDISIIQ